MRNRNLIESITKAVEGLEFGLKYERNIKIQAFIALLVVLFSLILNFDLTDKLLIFMWCGVVISAEFFNSAIERAMDVLSEEYSPKIKIVKDLSASAVFILALIALVSGLLIFFKYLSRLI
ncbi:MULTISPECIES: diacylglycerol kinase [Dictyoglomus]|jgi:diacylglycerol kinase|uniref:Diacylglycerol kinase n=1 Tax=Dictyoglomus turgidum (strain DSM 6724 / Z-1310) TaxID=515635 RepID=B8E0F6_DICTD|nr:MULTISPECIES: diacylglycerol kinase [Dictyoglomus]ACK42601.1 diacylglycerol kinase [Dictyoglomus turgidum DSM 6724]PNV80483.1 MAG: diacylglycerol kinase [Dictyoglomus turgidum]HBU31172.1 diacylglycerol kinase [Dictyoglomus sp.]